MYIRRAEHALKNPARKKNLESFIFTFHHQGTNSAINKIISVQNSVKKPIGRFISQGGGVDLSKNLRDLMKLLFENMGMHTFEIFILNTNIYPGSLFKNRFYNDRKQYGLKYLIASSKYFMDPPFPFPRNLMHYFYKILFCVIKYLKVPYPSIPQFSQF